MRQAGLLISLLVLCAGSAFGAPAASEASGKVVDAAGNPLAGVRVLFSPSSNPDSVFDTTTNKKGRYFVGGLFSTQAQGEAWNIAVEAEGYVVTHYVLESRTVNRVLIGDILDKDLRPGSSIPSILIRPLGSAKVDLTLTPEDQLPKQPVTQAAAPSPESSVAAQPKTDEWEEALRLASDGDLEGALPMLDKAVAAEPEDVERRETLAKVLYQLKRYEEAEKQAQAAIELSPETVEPRMVLYSTHMARGDLAAAHEVLAAAREVDPGNVQVLEQVGFVAAEAGKNDEAVAAYEELTRMSPDNTEAWLSLADLYAGMGQNEKSEAAYQRVAELDPANAHQVFFNLGALMFNKPDRTDNETRQAITAFRKALEINPQYAQAHKQLAFALLNVGDRVGAKGELQKYVELSPDAPDVTHVRQMIETLKP